MLHSISIKTFRVQLDGEWWIVGLFTPKEFVKLHGEGCLGITVYDHALHSRELHFISNQLTKNTIAHELTHAYLSHYSFKAKNNKRKSDSRIEEDFCELIGGVNRRIHELTEEIYKEFKKKTK